MSSRNIENIYPLSPMQEGMLFHTLLDREKGFYFQQLQGVIVGLLDTQLFQSCWDQIIRRHPALRTVFVWERQERPLQVVLPYSKVSVKEVDWRDLSESEQAEKLECFLVEDRAEGIDLTRGPVMRFTLFRLGEDRMHMVWSHHHLVIDGWSTGQVLREFQELYAAAESGGECALEAAQPYQNFITWLGQQDMAACEAFWRECLRGFDAPTPLPAVDFSSPAQADEATIRERRLRLGCDQVAKMEEFRRASHITANTVLTGAYGLLLSRASDEADVLFGLTVSGRPAELDGVESTVGLFINTVPLRLGVNEDSSVGNWLKEVQGTISETNRYEHAQLARVREWSDVASDSPLFESLFVYENYPLTASPDQLFGGIAVTDIELQERTNLPLTVIAEPTGDDLVLRFLYDSSRYTDGTIERLMKRFAMLIDGIISSCSGDSLAQLPWLDEQEEWQIVHDWNHTACAYGGESCMHHPFERQAAVGPEAVAVVAGDRQLTYKELEVEANRIAHHLISIGVRPGDAVAVCLDRCSWMVSALLGILKAGAMYVPLETFYPLARIDRILEMTGARYLLTQGCLGSRLAELKVTSLAHTVLLDTRSEMCSGRGEVWGSESIEKQPVRSPGVVVSSDQLAYVIFTSGSTGEPKGVSVRHRPAINLIEWVNANFSVGRDDRLLFITSLCFDLSVYDIFGILAAGGSIRVASSDEVADPEQLESIIRTEPITFWDSAPAALQQIEPFFKPQPAEVNSLRLVFLSGDWIPLRLPGRLKDTYPGVEVISLGGATEATVWSNFYPVEKVEPTWSSIPYGKPIQNARYYILDSRFRPCPVGVPGNLYIGGECLADGYLGRPDLTSERFLPDPFADRSGATMYDTGDRARFYPDGNIEFLGRLDDQVKIRGFRIELGEIEQVLNNHPDVAEAVIVVRESHAAGRFLSAYVISATANPVDWDELSRQLKAHLPPYMIPSAFAEIDQIPTTSNGKLDRKALPDPEFVSRTGADRIRTRITGELEILIAGLWAEILAAEDFNLDESFFELGGHSLTATRVITRLREALDLELPLRMIFEHPTVRGLAAEIRKCQNSSLNSVPDLVPFEDGQRDELSFAQSRLWFLSQLEQSNPFYNVPIAAEITGPFDLDAFAKAIQKVAVRHEVLRTRIEVAGDQPVQVISETPVPIEVREGDRLRTEIEVELDEEAHRPFDLATEIPLRAVVWRTRSDQTYLLLIAHHIAADGWSMGVLLSDIAVIYQAYANDREPQLPELPVQYADFAAWQKNLLQGEVLEQQLVYWRKQLRDLPILKLPTDRLHPSVQRFVGDTVRFELSEKLSAELRDLARAEGCTLFMVLLGGFEMILSWRSKQTDLVVGTDIANRMHPKLEGLIGFFVNQLVLRSDLSGDPSFRELLKRIRKVVLEAYSYQDVPFDRLVQDLNPVRDPCRMPLFQVKFVLQNAPFDTMVLPGLTVDPITIDVASSKYDLLLALADEPQISGRLEYDTELFDASTVQEIVGDYIQLLERVVSDPKLSLAALERAAGGGDEAGAADLRRDALRKLRSLRSRSARGAG